MNHIAFLYTMVGPMGSGIDGGLYRTVCLWSSFLINKGHTVTIIAPQGSLFPKDVHGIEISGDLQPSCQLDGYSHETSECLIHACNTVMDHHEQFDVIINMAYDMAPHERLRHLDTPVFHYISMCHLHDVFTHFLIKHQHVDRPYGFLTSSQRESFMGLNASCCQLLKQPFDINASTFYEHHTTTDIAWMGRISPEKGLYEALNICSKLDRHLHICGIIQDQDYFETCVSSFKSSQFTYHGYCDFHTLNQIVGQCECMLSLHQWEEAFGMTFIESMSFGTPVIASHLGSPKDLIKHGQTGYIVSPDRETDICQAITNAHTLSRDACRKYVEDHYSEKMCYDSLIEWISS